MDFNPDFQRLIAAFNKFTNAHSNEDITARVIRSVFTGGKAAVDQGMQEFPKSYISQTVKDFYALITSQDVADSIGSSVRSFDEAKVQEVVDNLTSQLKNPATALEVAKQVKIILNTVSSDDLEAVLDQVTSGAPLGQRMMFLAVFSQLKPVLEDMKTADVQDVANTIIQLSDSLPSDLIAAQLGDMTREFTPERISRHTHDLVGKMPSPKAVSDIVHGVGASASDHLDRAAKSGTPSGATGVLKQFSAAVSALIVDTLAKDAVAKKTPKKKEGGSFDL